MALLRGGFSMTASCQHPAFWWLLCLSPNPRVLEEPVWTWPPHPGQHPRSPELKSASTASIRACQPFPDETAERGGMRDSSSELGYPLPPNQESGLTFRMAAKAGPKAALTSTRSRIQAGSLARIRGRAYRWSRSTMLAKSRWCLMALPGQGQSSHRDTCPSGPPPTALQQGAHLWTG